MSMILNILLILLIVLESIYLVLVFVCALGIYRSLSLSLYRFDRIDYKGVLYDWFDSVTLDVRMCKPIAKPIVSIIEYSLVIFGFALGVIALHTYQFLIRLINSIFE